MGLEPTITGLQPVAFAAWLPRLISFSKPVTRFDGSVLGLDKFYL